VNMKQKYNLFLSFLSLIVSFTSLSQTIIRGPYLQKGTPTSVVIKWRTSSNTESIVKYGTSLGNLDETEQVWGTRKNHEVEILGLSSYTKYFYSIHDSSGVIMSESDDLYFGTHPAIGTSGPYTFWVLGNTYKGGIYNANAVNVREAYYSYIGPADTNGILFLGDNAGSGDSGTDSQYQTKVFDMYDFKLKNTIAWSCIGNLETWIAPEDLINGEYPYYDIFKFPKFGESGGIQSNTESYYSFDYGNIHFIVLNSADENRDNGINQGTSPSPMYTWAKNDIQSTDQKWIVALWHQPPFSHGWHNSDTGFDGEGGAYEPEMKEMRENFLPMLESNGVDLVLTAHSLVYERSYFINGFYDISDAFDLDTYAVGSTGTGDGITTPYHKTSFGDNTGLGTVYTVSSTASISATNGPIDHNAMFYSSSKVGSCILEVDGNYLTLKFLRDTGAIDDYFTIRKDYVYDEDGWLGGTDPNGNATVVEDILIKSGNAAITSHTTANDVVVNPEGNLTLNSSINLTANNIILESKSDKFSSLLSNGSINGTVHYDRYVNEIGSTNSNNNGNDLVSSPVMGEVFNDAFVSKNQALAENPGNSGQFAFAPFNTSSGAYENYDIDSTNDNTNEGSINLESGIGYRAATIDGSPLRFSGTAVTGSVSAPVANGEWNLIGNPYPSYLKVNDGLAGFLNNTTNISILEANNVGIYGYDATSAGGIWTIYNLTNTNSSTLIAPGQGFFVNTSGTGSNIEFTSGMRAIGAATDEDFIGGRNSSKMKVLSKLKFSSGLDLYSTDIYFMDIRTRGLDPGYDAGAFQGNAEGIFTNLVEDNSGIEMAIQALPYEDFNDVVVPVGIRANSRIQDPTLLLE